MSPAGFIVMQTDHLMADRTFCIERVKSPPSQELYELDNPDEQNTHGCLVVIPGNQLWSFAARTQSVPPLGGKLIGTYAVTRRLGGR
jgi:hypothetical protein